METTNISQRVAAISGAASGIGLALATLYARRGIRVIAGYYPDDPHDPTVAAAQVEEAGGDALWLPLNVADTASVDTFIAQGVAHYGRLDYVIANAGILRCASIEEMNDDRWNEMLNVDLTGVMRCFRAATPRLISGGSLVAISSIAGGVYGWQEHAHYAAAKAGVIGMTKALAWDLGKYGITCNCIAPGPIDTQMMDSVSEEWRVRKKADLALPRFGRIDEVVPSAIFLASEPDGDLYTGQTLGPNSGDVML